MWNRLSIASETKRIFDVTQLYVHSRYENMVLPLLAREKMISSHFFSNRYRWAVFILLGTNPIAPNLLRI